jgi:hypothetical protein
MGWLTRSSGEVEVPVLAVRQLRSRNGAAMGNTGDTTGA